MKKSILITYIAAVILSSMASFTSFAGEWKQDNDGIWYDNGNGTYPKETWQWIDGDNNGVAERYYFDENGYCMTNDVTPDGCSVDCDGAWILDGTVQIRYVGTYLYDEATKKALNCLAQAVYTAAGQGEEEGKADWRFDDKELGVKQKADILYWYQSAYCPGKNPKPKSVTEEPEPEPRIQVRLEVLDENLNEILGSLDNDPILEFFSDPENGYVSEPAKNGICTLIPPEEKEQPDFYLRADRCLADDEIARLNGDVMVFDSESGSYQRERAYQAYFLENPQSPVAGFRFLRLVVFTPGEGIN